MKLQNPDRLRVDSEKVVAYLLSPSHPHGRGKASFFVRFGFRVEDWELLAEALRTHGASRQVAKTVESATARAMLQRVRWSRRMGGTRWCERYGWSRKVRWQRG